MTTGKTLYTLRKMVDEFIREHWYEWEKVRETYKEQSRLEHLKFDSNSTFEGLALGRSLSLQSHIASDMLIDFVFLVLKVETGLPFTREYWIRSQGTQCITNKEDEDANRKVWKDILTKIKVEFDGKEFTKVEWVEDDDCLLKNKFIQKGVLWFN